MALGMTIRLLFVGILSVGLLVGCQQMAQDSSPSVSEAQEEQQFRSPNPRTTRVGLRIEENNIVDRIDHQPIYIWPGRGDKLVWEGDESLKDFEVSIRHDPLPEENRPDNDQNAPESPFTSGLKHWNSTDGRVDPGDLDPRAKGHRYKYTIKSGDIKLDPHICIEPTRGCF